MKLFDEVLILVLELFAQKRINRRTLRKYLAEKFFEKTPYSGFDYLILSEIEGFLAEYERGDRNLASVREKAAELSKVATIITEQPTVLLHQEPAYDLEKSRALA